MPLKPCRECGHEVSTEAAKCPQCGAVLKEGFLEIMAGRKKGSPVEINWTLRFIIGLLGLILALILFSLANKR